MSVSVWLIIMAVILVCTAIYSVNSRERHLREYGDELRALMDEAMVVRKDLEAVIENALMVSEHMVFKLDQRLQMMETMMANHPVIPTSNERKPRTPRRKKEPGAAKSSFNIEEIRRAHPYIMVPRLFNEGYSVQQIAEILGRGQGEVQLILDIQRKREARG